jgi:hypothetical protein
MVACSRQLWRLCDRVAILDFVPGLSLNFRSEWEKWSNDDDFGSGAADRPLPSTETIRRKTEQQKGSLILLQSLASLAVG